MDIAPSNPGKVQLGPPNCQGLIFGAVAYGGATAAIAAKDSTAKIGNYIKSAAPLLGASTWSAFSAIGEGTLGLLVGSEVEGAVAVGAPVAIGAYVSYKGIAAASSFYKEQNAACKTQ